MPAKIRRVASLLKSLAVGYRIQEAVSSPSHLDYYLNEFTFRFNRRPVHQAGEQRLSARARKLLALDPVPYENIVIPRRAVPPCPFEVEPQPVGAT